MITLYYTTPKGGVHVRILPGEVSPETHAAALDTATSIAHVVGTPVYVFEPDNDGQDIRITLDYKAPHDLRRLTEYTGVPCAFSTTDRRVVFLGAPTIAADVLVGATTAGEQSFTVHAEWGCLIEVGPDGEVRD